MGIIQTTKELRPREETDHYPTPIELCYASVGILPEIFEPKRVIDPGAGQGPWGYAVRQRYSEANILGIEMDTTKWCPDKYLWQREYNQWSSADYLGLFAERFTYADLIIGNPPYGRNADGSKDRNLAEKFVKRSYELLRTEGYLVFLLRLGFLEGQRRAKTFWPKYPLKDLYVLSRRPSFTGDQRTDATSYGLYVWQKGYEGPTYLKRLVWDYGSEVSGHQDNGEVCRGLADTSKNCPEACGQETHAVGHCRCTPTIGSGTQDNME